MSVTDELVVACVDPFIGKCTRLNPLQACLSRTCLRESAQLDALIFTALHSELSFRYHRGPAKV